MLLAVFVLIALLNVFGQRPTISNASANGASLQVSAPDRLRGGLLFQARFRFSSLTPIAKPILVLGHGWFESMSLNTTEPSATDEGIRGGGVSFSFPPLRAGKEFTFWTQWQANPTNLGSQDQNVALFDGPRLLTQIHRTVTVFP